MQHWTQHILQLTTFWSIST